MTLRNLFVSGCVGFNNINYCENPVWVLLTVLTVLTTLFYDYEFLSIEF
jgi:hypothetical protein